MAATERRTVPRPGARGRKALLIGAAASSLLAGAADAADAPETGEALPARADWSVDGSWLAYTESDDRVAVRKTLVDLARETDASTVNVQLVHDTMSGASPTGAVRDSTGTVTYTGASGGAGFETSGGEIDSSLATFEDTRVQAGVAVDSELDRTFGLSYGAVVSQESDYDSFGGNVGLKRYSADKATTFDAGVAATFDTIYRSERDDTPRPLGDASEAESFDKGQRNTFDALIGVTQILNRRTLAQVNVGLGASSGYHSDPYKVISAVDDDGRIVANLHDSRPDSRARATLFAKLVHRLAESRNSVHVSYRLYNDDWGVLSNTADVRFRMPVGANAFIEPHARLYRQSAADFYRPTLDVNERGDPVLPESGLASADYRLDAMSSATLGVKLGTSIGKRTDLRFRAEYLDQRFDSAEFDRLSAVILQTSVRYRF